MSLGHVEELNREWEGSCWGSALIASRLEGSPWEGAGETRRGDTSMFPAAAQSSGWKQLQRREINFPGCRGSVQVCAGITASFRGDLAAASMAPEVNFPFSAQIQRQKA